MGNQSAGQVKNSFVVGVDDHLHLGPARCVLLRRQTRSQGGADNSCMISGNGKKHINDSGEMGRVEKRLVAMNIHNELALFRQQMLDFSQPLPARKDRGQLCSGKKLF